MISTAQIGFEEPEFEKDQAKANLIAIKMCIRDSYCCTEQIEADVDDGYSLGVFVYAA